MAQGPNPVEYGRAYAKGDDPANFSAKVLAELNQAAIQAFNRIKPTPHHLRAFRAQSELQLDKA